jgi:DNA polymerase III subunit epsilon
MFAVIDIETTGGNYKTGKIIELAVALFDGKSVIDTFDTLINPGCAIPSFITGLTGIDNSMIKSAPYFHHVAKKFITMTSGHIFVAHNVIFDYNFIKQEYKELGYTFRMPRVCTLIESRKTFPELKSHGLGNLCRSLNIQNHSRHRALGDALATTELLKMIMEHRQVDFQAQFSIRED